MISHGIFQILSPDLTKFVCFSFGADIKKFIFLFSPEILRMQNLSRETVIEKLWKNH